MYERVVDQESHFGNTIWTSCCDELVKVPRPWLLSCQTTNQLKAKAFNLLLISKRWSLFCLLASLLADGSYSKLIQTLFLLMAICKLKTDIILKNFSKQKLNACHLRMYCLFIKMCCHLEKWVIAFWNLFSGN